MEDGMYISVFMVKNGIRYPYKDMSMKDVTKIMVDSLMNGILGTDSHGNLIEVKTDG